VTNIDTIREALTYYHAHSLSMDEHITANALAALSTIEADAKPQEPSEDARKFLELLLRTADNWVINPESLEESHAKAAALITAHDDAIRRECAERAVKWYNEPDNQNYMEKFNDDEYWDNELRAAILGTEPAREES